VKHSETIWSATRQHWVWPGCCSHSFRMVTSDLPNSRHTRYLGLLQNWGMPDNIRTLQFQLGKRTCYKSPASHCSPPDRTWSWTSAGLSGFEQGRDDIDATAAPDKSCRIHYGRDIDPQHLCGQNMSKLAIVEAIWSLLGMATHRNRDPIRCNSRSSCGFHRSSSSELADVTLSVVVDEKSGDVMSMRSKVCILP